MDQDYIKRLFRVLFESNGKEVYINQVPLPIPSSDIGEINELVVSQKVQINL